MKTLFILALLSGHALAAQPVLPRVTAKTIAELQAMDPMVRLVKPPAGETEVARPDNQSIVSQSTILNDGKNWTIVPKGAVVYVPGLMKSRVNAGPAGTLLPWVGFLTKNRAWITTCEVTVDQAVGKDMLPADRTEFWPKQDKVVVAVHQGGPISARLIDQNTNITKR